MESNARRLKASYHNHTLFCDGSETPEQMVLAAIEKGFTHIGFSAHAMYPFASAWHLPPQKFEDYRAEISRLRDAYRDRIGIFLGFEADYIGPFIQPRRELYSRFGIDYLIGSVHYIGGNGMLFTVDGPETEITEGIAGAFDGDPVPAVKTYYQQVREMVLRYDFDVVGHIDVVRRRNGTLRFFDETQPWYRKEIEETASAVAAAGKIVEINTGGIARGSMDDVYPSTEFLS
ncbi:MAG: histidinol-phosphatase, partial [Spirochaetaceae bacterium]|nr:histidinol-phosphatase [Spirochaetaceae bacterium]